MTPGFIGRTTSHFDRLAKSLQKQHQEFIDHYDKATTILHKDPYNRTRQYHIKKLENVPEEKGQYRLRLGRLRFRYDIEGHTGHTAPLRSSTRGYVLITYKFSMNPDDIPVRIDLDLSDGRKAEILRRKRDTSSSILSRSFPWIASATSGGDV